MATQAEMEQIANDYIDQLTTELLHAEFDKDKAQVKILRSENSRLWTETRALVKQALIAEKQNGTLDATMRRGVQAVRAIVFPAQP